MKRIYLDHAATSYPKAPGVTQAICDYLEQNGSNVGRGSYDQAIEAEEVLHETRHLLCKLLHFDSPSHVIFTPGVTYSLNLVMRGLLHPGDHCIVSGFEHNAVMRTLTGLGVDWSIIPHDSADLEAVLRPNTKLVVMLQASNVFGCVLPCEAIGKVCKLYGIPFIIDGAQSAGHMPVNLEDLQADAFCFSGHKGFLGPPGTGGLLIRPALAQRLPALIEGGTGSFSHEMHTPSCMPDKFEPGTPNIPGLWGLHAAIQYIQRISPEAIYTHEQQLTQRFLGGLSQIKGVQAVTVPELPQIGVVSLRFDDIDPAEVADQLSASFGIQTRCGLHCAPLAHQTIGTFPEGTVRFSFGYSTQAEEIDAALSAIEQIIKSNRGT